MSVRTAWEIAALEDVRLAPSPRQQRPAPGPVCAAGLLLTLPGAPAEDPGAADRRGARLGPVFPSSRLFCGFSALRAPRPLRDRWAGAWVCLGPSLFPPPALGNLRRELGVRPTAEPGQRSRGWAIRRSRPLCLSLSLGELRPSERALSPSRPWGRWPAAAGGRGHHRAHRVGECGKGRPDHVAPHPGPFPGRGS